MGRRRHCHNCHTCREKDRVRKPHFDVVAAAAAAAAVVTTALDFLRCVCMYVCISVLLNESIQFDVICLFVRLFVVCFCLVD